MKVEIIAILFQGVLLPAASALCTQYVCSKEFVVWDSESTCGFPFKNNNLYVNIRECPSGQFCAPAESDKYKCIEIQTLTKMYPGERCDDTHPCMVGMCMDGKCPAVPFGGECINAYDCGTTLTCVGGVCVKLAAEGSACSRDSDCIHGAGCADFGKFYGGAAKRECTKYWSIPPQHSAPSCPAIDRILVQNDYCASRYCSNAGWGSPLCTDLLPNSHPVPRSCDDSRCLSIQDSRSGLSLEGSCMCSLDGKEYCSLFPGDSDYVAHMKYQVDFMSSAAIRHCNRGRINYWGMISYIDPCNKPTERMIAAYYRVANFPRFVNADDCVLKILAPDYYRETHTEEESSWQPWRFSYVGSYLVKLVSPDCFRKEPNWWSSLLSFADNCVLKVFVPDFDRGKKGSIWWAWLFD